MGHLGPKMAHLHNSGSAVRNVLQFCIMKRVKRVMEINVNGFFQKNPIQGNLVCHFGPKCYVLITGSALGVFLFLILHNKRGQSVHENFISCFSRKNLIWGNLIFLGHFLGHLIGLGQNGARPLLLLILKQ